MALLLTGATGLIGSRLLEHLPDERRILAGSRRPDDLEVGTAAATPVSLRLGEGGLETDVDWTRVDAVVHTAAYTDARASVEEPLYCFGVNAHGTAALLEAARTADVDRFVALSTYHVYDDDRTGVVDESTPTDATTPYTASKLAAEAQGRAYDSQYDVDVTVLRPFNVYGPGARPHQVVPSFVSQALSERVIEPHPGNPVRDFLYVDDLCDAIEAVVESSLSGPINVGSGEGTSIHELARAVARIAEDCTGEAVRVDHAGDLEPTDPMVADTSRIERELGWSAETALSDGLRRTIEREHERGRYRTGGSPA